MKKRCKECGEWKPLSQFHKQGIKGNKQQYASKCKPCKNAEYREKYHTEGRNGGNEWKYKKQYVRARSRALTRLSNLVPELYEMCLKEELEKEGVPYDEGRQEEARANRRG